MNIQDAQCSDCGKYNVVYIDQQLSKVIHLQCQINWYYHQSIFSILEMKKVFKGDFVITFTPLTFHHKHLSLSKQKKDKEIKKEREQLEKKRKEFEQVKEKWTKEQLQYKVFAQKKKEENRRLILQDQKLKQQVFKLTIRRDQIQSRTNPQITIQKTNLIKRYLRCVSYTAGKKLQSIKFWKSQPRYQNLRFLLQLAVDRFFGRSAVQREIIGNLSRIVLCKKIKFYQQWLIFCIKQSQNSQRYTFKTSTKCTNDSFQTEQKQQKTFEIIVYAITGQYFHLSKIYTEQQLKIWAEEINRLQVPKLNRINQPRLSVADNLAKLNALRALGSQRVQYLDNKQNINSDQFKMISEENVSSPNSEINQTDQENSSQRPEQKKTETQNQSEENLSEINQSQPQSAKVKTKTAEKMKTNEKLGLREVKTNAKFRTKKEVRNKSRKQLNTKSSFFIKSRSEPQTCKLNHQFLMGSEYILFPSINPIFNVVILKQSNQIFMLQDYMQTSAKRLIIDKAVARYRLKMKLKTQIKKYLYYKKETVTACYQTIMAKQKSISLPCLFVIKLHQTSQKIQIYISCDSILIHPQIQNGLQIKALLHSYQKQRQEPKEELEKRLSNLKNLKNSNRRSRDSKLRSQMKHPSRAISIHHQKHQKSIFLNKKVRQIWTAFSAQTIQKYNSFLQKHVISIRKRMFVTRQSIDNAISCCAKIQKRMRIFLSKKRFKKAKELNKVKCVWRIDLKILVTALLQTQQKKVRLYIEQVSKEKKYIMQFNDYEAINWQVICASLSSTRFEGTFDHVKENLLSVVGQHVERQTKRRQKIEKQKPQRYKKMVQSFLFMVGLRNRARKNIFFLRKSMVRDRIFVLLIRRDRYVRSLLQCNLYDLICEKKEENEMKNTESTFKQQKQVGSEYGSNKARSRWKPQFDNKIYRYQKIYLMEQYFKDIDYKKIWDQFYIDKGVFLLKPAKTQNTYYIQRLATLDLNSQQFFRELTNYQKKDSLLKTNQCRLDTLSRSSCKKIIHKNISGINAHSRQALDIQKIKEIKGRKQSKSKKQKKTSIEQNKKQILFLKSNFQRQNFRNSQMISKKSFGESNSCKAGRQVLQIKNNSHQSIVYYSLYKEDGIFFYIQLFIICKTYHERGYSQELVSIAKQRLEKKQLQEGTSTLFYMKLAAWAHDNEEQFIKIQETIKDKNDDSISKKDQGSITNLVTLQFFNALIGGSKRFSFQNSIVLQKGPRTNTLIL